jgi:hypothetical protein
MHGNDFFDSNIAYCTQFQVMDSHTYLTYGVGNFKSF